MQERWAGAQRAWADDIATVTGDAVATFDRVALAAAAEAWKRGEANEEHTKVLFDAVTRMGGQFMQRVEREAAIAMRAGEDPNRRLVECRDELRELFRADVEALVREAWS